MNDYKMPQKSGIDLIKR